MLLVLEKAQILHPRAGCLGATLPQMPTLTGPLQAALLPSTHWRPMDACAPWDGWAEQLSLANGKTFLGWSRGVKKLEWGLKGFHWP